MVRGSRAGYPQTAKSLILSVLIANGKAGTRVVSRRQSILRQLSMEKQEFKSKWDELAREIGAEIPPETEQREQAVSTISESPTPEPKRREPVEQAPAPHCRRSSRPTGIILAGELGLPPVPYDEPVVEERPPQAEQRPTFRESLTCPRQRRIAMSRRSNKSRPSRGGRSRANVLIVANAVAVVGSGGIRRAKIASARRSVANRAGGGGKKRREAETKAGVRREERGRGREQTGRGRDEPRRRREPRESDDRPAMDVSEEIQDVTEIDSLHVELPVSPPSPPEPPTKSPAVSLWHKIFGSPAEQTAKMPEPARASQPGMMMPAASRARPAI